MKFSGMRSIAGNGPKYMRTLPFTIMASWPMASASTSTLPRRKCSAWESNASPSTSLIKICRPPAVAKNQRTRLNNSVSSRVRGAAEKLRGSRLFSEIERAFSERVHVTNHQDANKTEHAPEDRAALLDRVAIHDCPRIHKHDLEVEQDEEHCDDIKPNAEARLPFALRNHPAFVRRVLR